MDLFLDSIEPEFSDSESHAQLLSRYSTLQSPAPKRTVSRVLVALRPESVIFDAMRETLASPAFPVTCSSGVSVGSMFYFEDSLILCIDDSSIRFSVTDLVDDFMHLIVMGSQMYRENSTATLSTDSTQTTAPRDLVVDGIQAFLLTEAIKCKRQGSVIINLHTSIRIEFDGLWRLWETIVSSLGAGFPEIDPASVSTRFNRACPLNKKVPLYS